MPGQISISQDLFAEIWGSCLEELSATTKRAFARGDNWLEGIRTAAWAACRFLQADPVRARILLIEVHFETEMARASSYRSMQAFADMVDRGNEERIGRPVPREYAEAIVGAVWEIAVARARTDRLEELPEAVPQMMFLTVLPYLGPVAARDELRRGAADAALYLAGKL